jgi:hypothetical protein
MLKAQIMEPVACATKVEERDAKNRFKIYELDLMKFRAR